MAGVLVELLDTANLDDLARYITRRDR